MSLFFPVHRPRAGVGFTEQGLALAELRRGWHRPGIVRISDRPLPKGVLVMSASDPNVKDRNLLAKELHDLVTQSSERTLAVCLPDRVCALAVFPFETVPPRERERDTILRWRFQHEEHVTVADARILHRVFPVKDVTATLAKPKDRVTAYVLAMAIKRSVLDQYEQVCRQAGVLPMSISCASLWLFDFYRPVLTQAPELFFIHQASDSITFFAIRQGMPVFCRVKSWRHGREDVMQEVWSTVQFYEDLHPPGWRPADSDSVPIYMVGAEFFQVGGAFGKISATETVTSRKQATFLSKPIQPDWKALISLQGGTVSSEEGLYALACVGGL
jgi:hypothetical protein